MTRIRCPRIEFLATRNDSTGKEINSLNPKVNAKAQV